MRPRARLRAGLRFWPAHPDGRSNELVPGEVAGTASGWALRGTGPAAGDCADPVSV